MIKLHLRHALLPTTAAAALIGLLAPTAQAYTVTGPGGTQGWRSQSAQSLTWTRADSDPATFAVVLTNQDRAVLPHDLVLAKQVDGTRTSVKIYPPRGGFPTGDHFRVEFVKSADDQGTIYAQSEEFTISR